METHYTIRETGKTLKIAKSTIRRYIREGRLKAGRIGRVWRISESAIAEFLASNGGVSNGNGGSPAKDGGAEEA